MALAGNGDTSDVTGNPVSAAKTRGKRCRRSIRALHRNVYVCPAQQADG
jgi:hypothetical protein